MDVGHRHPREEDGEDSLLAPENIWCRPACCHAAQLDLLAGSDLETLSVCYLLASGQHQNIKTSKLKRFSLFSADIYQVKIEGT